MKITCEAFPPGTIIRRIEDNQPDKGWISVLGVSHTDQGIWSIATDGTNILIPFSQMKGKYVIRQPDKSEWITL